MQLPRTAELSDINAGNFDCVAVSRATFAVIFVKMQCFKKVMMQLP